MAEEIFESYTTGDDAGPAFGQVNWKAQTFTVGNTGNNVNFNITKIKLLLLKVAGTVGTVTVSIRAVNGDNKPTGADLSSGTVAGPTGGAEWKTINMSSYTLNASTQYAIVVRAPDASISISLGWRADTTSPGYTGGNIADSDNSGISWTSVPGHDGMFEVWGEEAPPGTNMKANIADVFKDISEIKINIGDVWKNVTKIQINIADVWKTVFG